MGDIENFIEFYKDTFDVYVLCDKYSEKKVEEDGVTYVRKSSFANYLIATADYIIDAGTITGKTKISTSQKRISVWHGIPYKNMFTDLDIKHYKTALEYCYGMDLMVSPSKFYSENFLQKSMLYTGEILETAVSRTDSLFLNEGEKANIKEKLNIPKNKKVLLYAPTYRERGVAELQFNPKKVLEVLPKGEWVIVTKLHYLNTLKDIYGADVIDCTQYFAVNNLLAITDFLVTDYSSLVFDYSILDKPAIFYQYDKGEYENDRGFMFELSNYVDKEYIASSENEFYDLLSKMDEIKPNLAKIKQEFYPHQKENSTAALVEKLALDDTPREIDEIIFLVNELNEIGGVHNFVLNLAKQFKERYNSKIIVIGAREFAKANEKVQFFDKENLVDIKISNEKNPKITKRILKNTNGYIIGCQMGAFMNMQQYLKNKKAVAMFHGDTKDIFNKTLYPGHLDTINSGKIRNYKKFLLLTRGSMEILSKHVSESVKLRLGYIENGFDFNGRKIYFKNNGEFVCVTRLAPDKNPYDIIKIFGNENLNPAYKVHVYGDGKFKNDFEEKVKELGLEEKIIVHGYCANKDEIYKDKQGLVMTSLSEGFSYVILEAYKYGIPVYSYNSFTALADVTDDSVGTLIETGNIEQYVKALNEPKIVDNKNYDHFIDKFSNDAIAKKWKTLFEELDALEQSDQAAKKQKKEAGKLAQKATVASDKEQATVASDKQQTPESKKRKSLKARLRKRVRKLKKSHEKEREKKREEKRACIEEKKKEQLKEIFESSSLDVSNSYAKALRREFKASVRADKGKVPLVSIIVPFYNNNKTIEAALDSIKKCGYKNYEVLVINDGSSENPESTISKFRNVRYFYKEHEGPGLARNFGIDNAKGKYVFFLGADDVICKGSIDALVAYAQKEELPVVCGLCRRVYYSTKHTSYWMLPLYKMHSINTLNNRERVIKDTVSTAKLYNLEQLKMAGIRFDSGFYEDVLFTAKVYEHFDKIGYVPNIVYTWYVYGKGTSITTSVTMQNVRDKISVFNKIMSFCLENCRVYYVIQFITNYMYVIINAFNNFTESEQKEIYSLLRETLLKHEYYIYEKLVRLPEKRFILHSLLDDNYEEFSKLAKLTSKAFQEHVEKLSGK